MKKQLVLWSLVLSLLLAAPVSAADPDPVDPEITNGTAARELAKAREKWLDKEVSSYRITVHRYCFCPSPFKTTVTVRKGKPVKVSARPWYGPKTVPAMFQVIGQAIRNEVAVLDVSYDDRLGIPKRTSIDYIAMAVDDEMTYRITGFRRVKR